MADSQILPGAPVGASSDSSKGSSAILGGGSITGSRLREGREPVLPYLASCSFHATAFSNRLRLASVTRRLKRGSVASVRNVSLRIFEYAGERPRWTRSRYSSVGRGGISSRASQRYIRYDDCTLRISLLSITKNAGLER